MVNEQLIQALKRSMTASGDDAEFMCHLEFDWPNPKFKRGTYQSGTWDFGPKAGVKSS